MKRVLHCPCKDCLFQRFMELTVDVLTLRSDRSRTLKWKVDTAFALHADMRWEQVDTISKS